MSVIDTYLEKRKFGKERKFTVFADKIYIVGFVKRNSRVELNIPLSTLNPERNRIWCKDEDLEAIGGLIFLPLLFGSIITPLFFQPIGIIHMIPLFIVLIGFGWAFLHPRQVEYAQFMTKAGTTGFDIGRIGPGQENFDGFLKHVEEHIRKANNTLHSNGESAAAPSP